MTQEQFNEMMNVWLAAQAKSPATWEQSEMDWATRVGLVVGDGENGTMPKKPITRGEMITVLHRFSEKLLEGVE